MKKLFTSIMFLSVFSSNLWATDKVLVNVVVSKGSSDSYTQTFVKEEVCNDMVDLSFNDMTKEEVQNHDLERLNINCKIHLDNGKLEDVVVYAGAGAINLIDGKYYTYSAFAKVGEAKDQVYKLSKNEFGTQETLSIFKEIQSNASKQEWFQVTFNFLKK